jgi:hypothetical protein
MRTGAIPAGNAYRTVAQYQHKSGLAGDLRTLQEVVGSLARRLPGA